ncbi:hypothetical protein DFH08DRAFT_835656 [Mycena albidolilacea]|uniref:Uncharacterized protein n=1 Tax=Mycena albidolilacea TaxID=1033008 RepID=A0AAD7ARX6_9AGAR|nr:hypothetical protein DFH08DRAFT_835656 [Mycena albidolilacea]
MSADLSSSSYFAEIAGKPPAEQLAALQEMLGRQNATKEGAQHLLNMPGPIANVLREQLVREQDEGQAKIETIQELIKIFTDPVDFTELEDKPPAEQMEALNQMLEVQNRITSGAQNLLTMADLSDSIRKQVVFEQDVAVARKEAIRRQIEILTGERASIKQRRRCGWPELHHDIDI